MNGFKTWTPADNALNLHSKWGCSSAAKPGVVPEPRLTNWEAASTVYSVSTKPAAESQRPVERVRFHAALKTATAVTCAVMLILSMTGCGPKTPTYSGPPDTVRQIVMKKWEIVPSRIVFPQGARVELIVSTADIEHGLGVSDLGINEAVQPGKPAVVRFLALNPGVYPMHCSVLCGRGHNQMSGEIVVEPMPGTFPGR